MRFNWCRQHASNGSFSIPFIASLANYAGSFTKSRPVFRHLGMMPLFYHSPKIPLPLCRPFPFLSFLPPLYFLYLHHHQSDRAPLIHKHHTRVASILPIPHLLPSPYPTSIGKIYPISLNHLAYADMAKCGCVDILYPTSILRPVYRHTYTAMSTARSGVRGMQRSERPATVPHYTICACISAA